MLDDSFEYGQYEQLFRKTLPELIIIGIAPPNDMWKRTAEYSPYTKDFDVPEGVNFEAHIEGKGKQLGNWVVSWLKPWVDSNYRTFSGQETTCIGGLSTSGVNAIYMISQYPEIFGRFLIHAPAVHLWIDKLLETIRHADYSQIRYGYFDIGTEEFTRMVKKGEAYADLQIVMQEMLARGLNPERFRFVEIWQGLHDCSTWKMTFPDALRYVFYDMLP